MYETGDNEDEKTEKYVKTDDEVPENLISENVARACRGTKSYWIRSMYQNLERLQTLYIPVYIFMHLSLKLNVASSLYNRFNSLINSLIN